MTGSFQRYLRAKTTVDDRALNTRVWEALRREIRDRAGSGCLRVLEIGGGIGTMATRMLADGLFGQVEYTLIDSQTDNIACAARELPERLTAAGYSLEPKTGKGRILARRGPDKAEIRLEAIDVFDFIHRETGQSQWDLIIANAFLDLMPLPGFLQQIAALGTPGSLHYYSINFDGETTLEPVTDAELDERIIRLYHRSMDERLTKGMPSGDSRSGRHLIGWLHQIGHEILAAGSSDWVVYPQSGSYPADEAWFLEFILGFFESSLTGNPELSVSELQTWLAQRRAQIARGELVLIVHQLDFLARQTR